MSHEHKEFSDHLRAATNVNPKPLTEQGTISLTQGEAVSPIEAADAARKLEFHEARQLYDLNTPLDAAGLAFTFQPEDVRRAHPQECDVLTVTESVIAPEGSDHAMALIRSTKGFDAEGRLLTGKFDPIFMTNKAYEERGGKIVVLTDTDTPIPQGEVQGRVQIPAEMLGEINGQLSDLNRTPLNEELAGNNPAEGVETVSAFEIIPPRQNQPAWVESLKAALPEDQSKKVDELVPKDTSNEFFYKRGHVGLVLHMDSGRSQIITKNSLNERKEHGSVNLVELTDGRYGIVNTVRMLVGAGANYRPEISRGYADIKVEEMTKKIREKFGDQWSADQLGMEVGLLVKNALKVDAYQLRQDTAYEDVTPKLQVLTFDKDAVMRTAPGYVQQVADEFEGLTPKKATADEILYSMDRGVMVDGFSMAVFGKRFFEKGLVKVNPRYNGAGVVLERRGMVQFGKRETLVVPSGRAFAKGARTVGQAHPNTGNTRFWYQARFSNGNTDLLPEKGKFEKVSIHEVVEKIKNLEFSTVDSAVLFRTLYNQRVFVPNF